MTIENELRDLGFSQDIIEKVIEGTNATDDLQVAMNWIEDYQKSMVTIEEETAEDSEPKALICNDCQKLFSSVLLAQLHATKTGHGDFAESSKTITSLSPEEKERRLAELKEKLDIKRKEDFLLKEKEARNAEMKRRKAGAEASDARRAMKEKQILIAAEQLKNEKEEARLIKEKIRQEMALEKKQRKLDREETALKIKRDIENDSINLRSNIDSNSTRIQVKFSDGKSMKATFDKDEKLSKLVDQIRKHIEVGEENQLYIPFPRIVIDLKKDINKTFQELNLFPSTSLCFQ